MAKNNHWILKIWWPLSIWASVKLWLLYRGPYNWTCWDHLFYGIRVLMFLQVSIVIFSHWVGSRSWSFCLIHLKGCGVDVDPDKGIQRQETKKVWKFIGSWYLAPFGPMSFISTKELQRSMLLTFLS